MARVENLLSQRYLLNRDVLFSYLDRRSTTHFHPTSTTVNRVWTLSGIWFLSAAAAARTLTVGDSPAVRDGRRVTGENSLNGFELS